MRTDLRERVWDNVENVQRGNAIGERSGVSRPMKILLIIGRLTPLRSPCDRFCVAGHRESVTLGRMSDVTRLLDAAAAGDLKAAAELLPLVYDELRRLARARMLSEAPDHTLDATALVHEAYLRLIGPEDNHRWDGRGHFFAAAAEAMRRVLVDRARDKGRQKRDGGRRQVVLADIPGRFDDDPHLLLSLNEALTRLSAEDAAAADVAKLHLFAGLSVDESAVALGVSRATAYRNWAYARAWLQDALDENP
jgi:RNA polymerase sigma factor (TIGR02999 family)